METRTLKILLLEDNPNDAELIARELKKGQVPSMVRRVENRLDFLRELREFGPDVVLSDFTLPAMNALEAIDIVQLLPNAPPFVLVTGSQSEEVAAQCIVRGADDYLLKTNLVRLPSAVLSALRNWEARREREKAVAALRRSEEQFRLIAENTQDLISILNRDGFFVYASPSFRTSLGYNADELLGKDSLELVHNEDRKRFLREFQSSANGGSRGNARFRYLCLDGKTASYEAVWNWIKSRESKPLQAICIAREVLVKD